MLKPIVGDKLTVRIITTDESNKPRQMITNVDNFESIPNLIWNRESSERQYNFDQNQYTVGCLETLSPSPEAQEELASDKESEFELANKDHKIEQSVLNSVKPLPTKPRRSQRSNKGECATTRVADEQSEERLREIQKRKDKAKKKTQSTPSPETDNAFISAALPNKKVKKCKMDILLNYRKAMKSLYKEQWLEAIED